MLDPQKGYVSLPTVPASDDYNSQKHPSTGRRTRGITGRFLIRECSGVDREGAVREGALSACAD